MYLVPKQWGEIMDQTDALKSVDAEIDVAISRLRIEDGDFVVVRMSTQEQGCVHGVIQSLGRAVESLGRKNVTVCLLDKADSIVSLKEDEMAKNGWIRKPVLAELVTEPVVEP